MKVFFLLALLWVGGCGFIQAQSDGGSTAQQIQIHEQKANEFLSQKMPELAAKEFAAILAVDPHNLNAQANLGVLLYFQRDYAGAEPHLRNAFEQNSDLTKIRALLGMCERHLGEMGQARIDLEAVVPELKDNKIQVEAGLELVEIYSASQDLEKAAGVLSILRQTSPTDPRVLYAAYRIHSDLAGEALLDMSIAAPDSGQMYQAMAHELYRQGDLPGAITNFRKALAADPNLPGIHFELAEALHSSPEQKLKVEAEQEYRLAVAANKSDDKAVCRLGDILLDNGNLDEAEGYYKQALLIAPGSNDAEAGLAFVYAQKDDLAAALPLLEHVVAADPTNIMAHYRLSTVYRRLNRPEDSKRELDAYKKYKDLKEKLRTIYKDMRSDPPVVEPSK